MKGDIQINEAERNAQLSSLTREIATIITTLTIDPASMATPPAPASMTPTSSLASAPSASLTGASSLAAPGPSRSAPARPHTVGIIEKAMTELAFGPRTDRSAKAQALELIKRMEAGEGSVRVKRVRMRVRVTLPTADADKVSKPKGGAAVSGGPDEGKGGKKVPGKGGKGNKKGKRRGDESDDELDEDMGNLALGEDAPKKETLKERVKGLAEEVESEETTSAEWESVGAATRVRWLG